MRLHNTTFKETNVHDSQQRFMLVLLAALAIPCAAQPEPQYAYTAVGLSPFKGTALSISNSGNVTGSANGQAFLYSASGLIELGTLPGDTASIGYGVNNAGQVVGASSAFGNSRAFLYADGSMTDLGSLDNSDTEANGINDAGDVVGVSRVGGVHWRGFLYRQGVMTSLGTLPGAASNSIANAINRGGQIAGSADYDPYNPYNNHFLHAFLYENGVMKDLGSLGGATSNGNGINDIGQVVGSSTTIPGNGSLEHAFLYADGAMRDLGTPISGTSSYAKGINNQGQVVGWYSAGNGRAFLYQSRDGMRDLSSMVDPASGWYIHAAFSINDRQQIVALGCKDGHYGAVLLNPTHRDGLIAAGPGAAATASASPTAPSIGAPENPQCGHG
jgi:probable HAF family extracellular repeat protein